MCIMGRVSVTSEPLANPLGLLQPFRLVSGLLFSCAVHCRSFDKDHVPILCQYRDDVDSNLWVSTGTFNVPFQEVIFW